MQGLLGRLPFAPLGPQAVRQLAEQKAQQYMPQGGGGRIIGASGGVINQPSAAAEIGAGLSGLGQALGAFGDMRKQQAILKKEEAARVGKIGAVRNALFGNQETALASHGGPTNAAAAEMRTGNALGLTPEMAQAVMGITEADPDMGFKMVAGLMESAQGGEGFTLSPGQTRFGPGGEKIASAPALNKPSSLPTSFQEYELAKTDGGFVGTYADWVNQKGRASAPTTTVNVGGAENPQAEIWAKQGGEAFKGYVDTGKKASEMQTSFRNLRGLAKMAEIKPGARTTTGFLKNYDAVADFFGAPSSESLGLDPKKTGAREAITSMVNNLVLQYKNVVGLGSQGFTEGDRMFLEEVFPRLGDTETGFDLKLQALEGLTNQQVWVSKKAREFRNLQRDKNVIFDDADFQDWLGNQEAPEFFKGLTEEARRAGLLNEVTAVKTPSPEEGVDVDTMTLNDINAFVKGLSSAELSQLPIDVLNKIIERREAGK